MASNLVTDIVGSISNDGRVDKVITLKTNCKYQTKIYRRCLNSIGIDLNYYQNFEEFLIDQPFYLKLPKELEEKVIAQIKEYDIKEQAQSSYHILKKVFVEYPIMDDEKLFEAQITKCSYPFAKRFDPFLQHTCDEGTHCLFKPVDELKTDRDFIEFLNTILSISNQDDIEIVEISS